MPFPAIRQHRAYALGVMRLGDHYLDTHRVTISHKSSIALLMKNSDRVALVACNRPVVAGRTLRLLRLN
jgi:hypothetical protein